MDRENFIFNIDMYRISDEATLNEIEKRFRGTKSTDFIPWARNTDFAEIANNIRDINGPWVTPLYFIQTKHRVSHGITEICQSAEEYLKLTAKDGDYDVDVLSISAKMDMDNSKIVLHVLCRPYINDFNFKGFFQYVGDPIVEEKVKEEVVESGNLIIPDEIKNFSYSEEDYQKHDADLKEQHKVFEKCTKEVPFLNAIEHYTPEKLPMPEDTHDFIYDLRTSDMRVTTRASYEDFTRIFNEVMTYVNGVEYYSYINVISGEGERTEESFLEYIQKYVEDTYVAFGKMDQEDVPVLMDKLNRSLFQLYVTQDLINDPNVTDIKITAPDSIRARVKGKAYISNIDFIDETDYNRFVNVIAIRNHISLKVPEQTFTDTKDPRYILRFSVTAPYVNSVPWPYLHIRKIDRNKPLSKELIEAGMMDEKIRDYLLDCGKNSRGVVFAGPPGSGKTICLNWFLEEAYEQSAEILVIQENDELFAYRKGVMFQHVVNYGTDGRQPVSLEQLGQLALVAGANVFIIGEAKGAEICSAITLSNSGCRTAITIHSLSSTDTLDKMADLAMRGYANDYLQAKRMLRSFQTIVYLDKFQIREISEVVGFNEQTQDLEYKYIYRQDGWKTQMK